MSRGETADRDRDSVIATALGTLRDDLPAVPTGLVDDILSYVFEGGIELPADRRHRIWWFVTAGVVAAVVGGVFTGVLVRWRQGKLAADLARLGLASRS